VIRIGQALQSSDEHDRQSVSLIGTSLPKETQATKIPYALTQQKSQTIELDPKCLSHTSLLQNDQVLKAFKMACLGYNPSPVEFDDDAF